MEGDTMLSREKRVISRFQKGMLACGLIIALAVAATVALASSPSSPESQFTTYTIVDPGNGENGTTILTWDQIPSWNPRLTLNIGDTVNILATTSPTVRTTLDFTVGQNRLKDDIPVGVVNTITGVAGVTYDNITISVYGDTTVEDLSLSYAYGTPLTFRGAQRQQTNYYYHNYPATLTVNGDCSFVASALTGGMGSGIEIPLYSVLELTIDGSGSLAAIGNQSGIMFLYDDYLAEKDVAQKAVLTINIPVFVKLKYYAGSNAAGLVLNNGSGSAGHRKFEVNGTGSLTAIATNEVGTGANGELAGCGISSFVQEVTFSGDLEIYAKGYGMRDGLFLERCTDLVFDLKNDAVFESGDYSSALRLFSAPGPVNVVNKGKGNVVFRGVDQNGVGIGFYNSSILKLSNPGGGKFIVNGGGYGSGLYMIWRSILDISELDYDLELVGGETTPTRQPELPPWAANPVNYFYRCSAGLLIDQEGCGIILGNNNLLCQGGANGGSGIDFIRAGTFSIESTGGQVYALGGKGPFGYGLRTGTGGCTLSGNGTINAYGGYENEGVYASGRIYLGSGVTLNAIGGAKAPDVVGIIVQ